MRSRERPIEFKARPRVLGKGSRGKTDTEERETANKSLHLSLCVSLRHIFFRTHTLL